MKVGFLSLMLAAAGVVIPVAAQAVSEHYQLDIPRQQLDAALKDLAQQTGLQIARFSDTPGGSAFVGPLRGDMPVTDALKTLLAPSKLTYKIVNDHTIAVMTLSAAAAQTESTAALGASQSNGAADGDPKQQEGNKSFWDRLHLAEVDPRKTSSASSVGQASDQSPQDKSVEGKLTEIIVTAQKKAERLQDVPVPVSTLPAQELVNYNQLRVQDFAMTVPGLSFSPQGSQAQEIIEIRGITTGIGSNPTVGITVDDVPFTSAQNAGNNVPDIDPNDLERIEVLRGPQGTLYGASSMGGLLKFVTKDPSLDAFSGNVSAGTSSVYNGAELGYNFRASANVPLSDNFAMRVSAFTRQDPGYIDNPIRGIDGINEEHASGGRISALWKPSDSVSLKVSALYQDIKSDGSFDVNSGPGYAGSLGDLQQNYPPNVGGFDRRVEAYSAILNAMLGSVELTSVTGYNVNAYRDSWDFTPEFGGASGLTATQFPASAPLGYSPVTDDDETRKISQEIRLSGSITRNMDWLAGAFFAHEHSTAYENIFAESSQGAIVGQWVHWNNPDTYQEEAGFADLTYRFTDQFDVQVGGRESHIVVTNNVGSQFGPLVGTPIGVSEPVPESATNANVFTYLVTPRFKVSADLMVYARFASGYRPSQTNGEPLPGIPAQSQPDKTENYELGVKGDFMGHRLSIDASLYYINWKQIQEFVTVPSGPNAGFGYTDNGGAAKSEGVEFSLTYKPFSGLTMSAWVAYDDAALTQPFPPGSNGYGVPGERLPFSTRWSGNASAEEDFPLSSELTGFVGGQISVVGNRFGQFAAAATLPRQYYPTYTQANLRTGAKYNLWTANLYVNNLTDRRGLLGGGIGEYPPDGFQYITPRTVGLNLSRAF